MIEYLKLAWMIFELLTNTEKFVARCVEEIKSGKHDEHLDNILVFLKNRYKCDDVIAKIDSEFIVFTLVNTEEDGSNIIDMVMKMLKELRIFLSDDRFDELKESLGKIEFVRTEGKNDLDVRIPIYNDEILDKIREVVPNE